ncbi:MAG: hypothetical protein IJS22_05340 [Lachnospiraceae bacterium]|nr:hypothetical protein [Lachnospiraceae bacterium]
MQENIYRPRLSLDGVWQFSIPGGLTEPRKVPGSYECVGVSEYRRTFTVQPCADHRTHLCFEGITYEAEVLVNGETAGSMLPYSYYSFDITGLLRGGENELLVKITDLKAPFGPSEGWKSYSGIVRSVYLEMIPDTYLDDVFFHTDFDEGYHNAFCTVECTAGSPSKGLSVRCTLLDGEKTAAEAASSFGPAAGADVSTAEAAAKVTFTVPEPSLWSPDSPRLYTLCTELISGSEVIDADIRQVGMKDFKAVGARFCLNGKDLFITGVCRHDIWTDEAGFTQTEETIETDLRMIKAMGANYVRLVHYPHDRRVVEAADRIGLLVSEEPGLWWNDLSDREITTRALEVLRRVIRRDRSHVSIAFWLSFNECRFNEDFLRDAVAVSRQADPTRLISGANCNDIYETKRLFDKYDVDFYTMHPYGSRPDHVNGESLEKICRVCTGKPVLFTEWGGYYVVNNPNLFNDFCNEMQRLHENREPEPVLAGMSYWQWQDIPEAQRGEPACFDGILTEGLVTIDRKIKNNYHTFGEFLTRLRTPKPEPEYIFTPVGAGMAGASYEPLEIPAADGAVYRAALEASKPMPGYVHKKERRLTCGPALKYPVSSLGALPVSLAAGTPLTAAPGSSVDIRIGRNTPGIWFIGHATLGTGWPYSGEYGEEIGSYTIRYSDGTSGTVPLRNGIETASACCLIGPTLCDPRCAAAPRAFRLSYDRNWEIYQANLFRVAADPARRAESVTVHVSREGYFLLLYGITVEKG